MDLLPWTDWLLVTDQVDCHGRIGSAWEDGCCRHRRGRLARLRLALWLRLVELGYL